MLKNRDDYVSNSIFSFDIIIKNEFCNEVHMNRNFPFCVCEPIARVGILGAQLDSLELIFSSDLSDLEIQKAEILICSENTQERWFALKLEKISKINHQKFLISFEKNIFQKETKLFSFDNEKFTQLRCNIIFKIDLTILSNGISKVLSNQDMQISRVRCIEQDKFEHFKFDDIHYSVSRPAEDNKKHPLIICLHGAGEGGDNQSNILADRMVATFLVKEHSLLFNEPYILAPQCPSFWLDEFILCDRKYIGLRDYTDSLIQLVNKIMFKYQNIDKNRIYIIGSSMGGYQALKLISHSPDLFSATVVSCPAKIPKNEDLKKINIPLWFIHSQLDEVVPISNTEYILDYIQEYNSSVKKTYFLDVVVKHKKIDPHCVFLLVYDNSIYDGEVSIFQWLATQNKE